MPIINLPNGESFDIADHLLDNPEVVAKIKGLYAETTDSKMTRFKKGITNLAIGTAKNAAAVMGGLSVIAGDKPEQTERWTNFYDEAEGFLAQNQPSRPQGIGDRLTDVAANLGPLIGLGFAGALGGTSAAATMFQNSIVGNATTSLEQGDSGLVATGKAALGAAGTAAMLSLPVGGVVKTLTGAAGAVGIANAERLGMNALSGDKFQQAWDPTAHLLEPLAIQLGFGTAAHLAQARMANKVIDNIAGRLASGQVVSPEEMLLAKKASQVFIRKSKREWAEKAINPNTPVPPADGGGSPPPNINNYANTEDADYTELPPSSDPTNVDAAAEALARLRGEGVGDKAEDKTVVSPNPEPPLSPTTIDTITANADNQLSPTQKYIQDATEWGVPPRELNANLTILRNIAAYRGEDLDTFLTRTYAGFHPNVYTADPNQAFPEGTSLVPPEVLLQGDAYGKDHPATNRPESFYSKAYKVISEKMPKILPAKDIERWLKKNQISDADIAFLGLDELTGTVTKQELLDRIEENYTNLDETILPTSQYGNYKIGGEIPNTYREMFITRGQRTPWIKVSPEEARRFYEDGQITDKEYQALLRDGGYRSDRPGFFYESKEDFEQQAKKHPDETYAYWKNDRRAIPYSWRDGHPYYEKQGIHDPIVRLRMTDRVIDGKKTLYIEEMQGPTESAQYYMPPLLRKNIFNIGVKRAITYAKENGYDRIAWPEGALIADLYGRREKVEKIASWYFSVTKKFCIGFYDDLGNLITGKTLTKEDVIKNFPPIVAEKILESSDNGDKRSFVPPEDMYVGGEGLIDTYDVRLPSLFRKLGKGEYSKGELGTGTSSKVLFRGPDIELAELKRRIKGLKDRIEYIKESIEIDPDDPNIYATYDRLRKFTAKMQKFALVLERGGTVEDAFETTNLSYDTFGGYKVENVDQFGTHFFDLTDKTPESFPLYQTRQKRNDHLGAMMFLNDGRALITLFEEANPTTLFHETAHMFRRWLLPEDALIANEWVGAKDNIWTLPQEEMWSRAWERYLRRGKAPNSALERIFEQTKTWFRRIYKTIKGSAIDVPLDPKIVALFDKILTPKDMPSQKPEWAMTKDTWRQVYGEDLAAISGVGARSVAIRKPSRFNTLVDSITGKGSKGNPSGRFMNPKTTEAQLAIVSDPAYLQGPLAAGELDTYVSRVLNLFSTRANASFHLGQPLDEILLDLQNQYKSADSRGLFDHDPGVGYADMGFQGFMTRRQMFEDTIKFISNLKEVQRIQQEWATPVREQLLNLKQRLFKGTKDVVMDKKTGRFYSVETRGVYSSSLIDIDRGDIRRVPNADLTSKFVLPEILQEDNNATLGKEDWLNEKHYEIVRKAVDNGEEVPSYVLADHLEKDPTLQEVYDRAVAAEKEANGEAAQERLVEALAQERYSNTEGTEPPEEVTNVHPQQPLKDVLSTAGKVIDEGFKMLKSLSNVLDFETGPKFLSLVKKTELQELAGVEGKVGEKSAEGYLADIFKELDSYRALMNSDLEITPEIAAKLLDRVSKIASTTTRWANQIFDSGYGRMLYDDPTVDQVRRVNHWIQRNILNKEPSAESTVTKWMEKSLMTMQGLSYRHPVLKPLFKSWIKQQNDYNKMQHDIFIGREEPEIFTITSDQGVVQVTTKLPGLRTLRSLATNSPAYKMLSDLIIVGDQLRRQHSMEEILGGFGPAVKELQDKALAIMKDPSEKAQASYASLRDTAIALQALSQLLEGKSIEERQLAAKAYFELQDTLHYMYYKKLDTLTKAFGEAGGAVMKKIVPQGYIPGYFPHVRSGDYGVSVKAPDGQIKYMRMYEDWSTQRNSYLELKKMYPEDAVSTFNAKDRLDYHLAGGQDFMSAIQDLTQRTKINTLINDLDVATKIHEMLKEEASEMVKSTGIFTKFNERMDIPGFDERILKVMSKEVMDFSHAIAKFEFARTGAQELAGLRSSSHLYNYSKEWFGAMLEGANTFDNFISKARALIFMKHLGWSIKTALVMTMDKLTNVPAVMGRYTNKNVDGLVIQGIKEAGVFMSWLHQVQKTMNAEGISREAAIQKVGYAKGFDALTTNAALWSKDSGATLAKFAPSVFQTEDLSWGQELPNQSKMGRALDVTKFLMAKTFDTSAWMGSKVEEFNKLSTFLSAYKMLTKEKKLNHDRALEIAQDIVNDAHVVYGKGNTPLPFLRKGVWRLAKLTYIFRAFEHNYVQMLANMSTVDGTRGKMMALRSLATLAALGGVPSLPFFVPLAKIYGLMTGNDPEQWFRRTLNKYTGHEWMANLFSDGLPSVGHVSLRGSMQVGAYVSWEELLGGVAGTQIKDFGKLYTSANSRDWDTFVKTLLPAAASAPIKAVQGARRGVMMAKGSPLRENVIGEPIKYSKYEALMRAANFSITKDLRAQRLRQAILVEDSYWGGRRQSIFSKFAKGARTDDKAMIQSALVDIQNYNRDIVDRKAYGITPISQANLRQSLQEAALSRKQALQVLRMTGQLP